MQGLFPRWVPGRSTNLKQCLSHTYGLSQTPANIPNKAALVGNPGVQLMELCIDRFPPDPERLSWGAVKTRGFRLPTHSLRTRLVTTTRFRKMC